MKEYIMTDLEAWNGKIERIALESGLDFFDTEFEICSYEEMLAYEAYNGMPSHYPHWSYGKAFERLHTLYRYNLIGLPYEMVINSNPCLAYLMRDNNLLLQILTMAHVYGHNDFFKNNRLFKHTRPELTVEIFKNHAERIRNYIQDPSIGYQRVERILDAAHALRYQTNRFAGIKTMTVAERKQKLIDDYRRKATAASDESSLKELLPPDLSKVPLEPEADLLWFLAEYAPLEEWEKDILMIARSEAAYFLPQIETKILNEGWASFWHYRILQQLELTSDLQFEFLKQHHQVIRPLLGGLNPYHLGFTILQDLERRFGTAKLFEVREIEGDASLIRRYLTQDLCRELHLFEYFVEDDQAMVTEVSDDDGWQQIRETLSTMVGIGSIPVIEAWDSSKKDRTLFLKHDYDGRELDLNYTGETLKYIVDLWQGPVSLHTCLSGFEKKIFCDEQKRLSVVDE